jgi:hypothetical protein
VAAPTRLYPPSPEIEALWSIAGPVDQDRDIGAWLKSRRKLDPERITRLDLARALSKQSLPLPRWAGFGGDNEKPWRSWPSAGLQLLVPLHDAQGAMRSMLFRRSLEIESAWPPKSIAANGFERAGLVMVNDRARQLLTHPVQHADGLQIVIEEGEMDWLTGCLAWASANERAIFGVMSGSWTEELAERIPRGARVTIRTDNDAAGDLLADKIAQTLLRRCTVLRGGRKKSG